MAHVHQMINILINDIMNTLKSDLQKCLPSSWFFLFYNIHSAQMIKCSKNHEKGEFKCAVAEFD